MSSSAQENNELKILQDNKDHLISVLPSVDIIKFSDELCKSVIISKEAYEVFLSLDHYRLDSKLRLRYLLHHISEGVKRDISAFYRFLHVLNGFGGHAGQLSEHFKRELHVFWREADSELQASEQSSTKVVATDINLSEADVPIVMETLVEVSNKWEEIGITLGLPRLIIKECRSSTDAASLTNILCGWISCNQKEITLKKLKLALDSQLVGRSSFSPFMEENFREAKSTKVSGEKKDASVLKDQASDETGSSEAVVAKISLPFGNIYLTEEDVSILCESLVVCAHKWNPIGKSLGLPVSIMKELEVKCLTSEADTLCLRDVLYEWLIGVHQTARPTTLKNLKLALESQLDGLYTVTNLLDDRCIKARRREISSLSLSVMPAAKRPHLDSTLEIVHQPRDVDVADGKSTLLDVQVNLNESVSYEWMKNGHSISDDQAYFDTCTDILVVRLAGQGSDAKFTCRISKGSEELTSKAVVLTVIFPPEKKHLMNLYSKRNDIPKNLWPTIDTSTFINVSLFKKNRFGYDDYNYSVRGDVVDILKTKQEVDYEEVFGEYERKQLLLVEGRPGCGKTTLIHKVTRDWAIRGGALRNAKLVFHIPLQNFANRKDVNLSDLLGIFYPSKEEREKVVRDIKNSQGEGVVFIFDGLEQYHPRNENKSVIHHMFRRVYLPSAMIIVISCPLAAATLTRETTVTRRIEVLGFTKPQIFEYIDNFPFSSNDDTSLSNLKAYLDSHLNVLHMCYLPVHAAMICFLYEHENGDIPHTEAEIYEHLTRFFILRTLRRSNKKALLHSLQDIHGKDKEHFRKLCALAFDMTIHSKQVILRGATQVHHLTSSRTGPELPNSFGLLTIDNKAALYGHDHTYCFLHLTIQNYLAAFYIAQLEEDEQMEMIRLYAGEQNMMMVWKFFFGIVKFEGKEAQVQQIMSCADSLHRVQYAFESQQRVVCDNILEFGRISVLDFQHCILTHADLTAVAYVISTTSYPVTKLVMKGCNLHGDHVRAFMREVSNNKLLCIETLDLSCNNIGADGAAALAEALKFCDNLQTLHLSDTNIGAEGAETLANLKCRIHQD